MKADRSIDLTLDQPKSADDGFSLRAHGHVLLLIPADAWAYLK